MKEIGFGACIWLIGILTGATAGSMVLKGIREPLGRPALRPIHAKLPVALPTCEAPEAKEGEPYSEQYRAMRAKTCVDLCDWFEPCQRRCEREYDWCDVTVRRYGHVDRDMGSCLRDVLVESR